MPGTPKESSTDRPPFSVGDLAVLALSGVIPIVALLWALLPANPYGYFMFLRIVVTVAAFIFCATFSGQKRDTWMGLFFAIGVLFNPVFPVHLTRSVWVVIDIATIGVFAIGTVVAYLGTRRRPAGE